MFSSTIVEGIIPSTGREPEDTLNMRHPAHNLVLYCLTTVLLESLMETGQNGFAHFYLLKYRQFAD